MDKKDYIKKIKKEMSILILDVLSGNNDAKSALGKLAKDKMGLDKNIDKAWHELYHFYSDEDIRKRDNKYAKYQIKKLQKIAIGLSEE